MAGNADPGELTRALREQAGLTQRGLARIARTAQSVVARIELGTTSPTVDTLRRLARAAGFDIVISFEMRPVLDRAAMADVPRILSLSPEDRLREVANLSAFVAGARRRARRG
jgi:transcriptional regulator with XRE-family HTH domain